MNETKDIIVNYLEGMHGILTVDASLNNYELFTDICKKEFTWDFERPDRERSGIIDVSALADDLNIESFLNGNKTVYELMCEINDEVRKELESKQEA